MMEINATYIRRAGLRGAMQWSLDGDDGSLVHVLHETLNETSSD